MEIKSKQRTFHKHLLYTFHNEPTSNRYKQLSNFYSVFSAIKQGSNQEKFREREILKIKTHNTPLFGCQENEGKK